MRPTADFRLFLLDLIGASDGDSDLHTWKGGKEETRESRICSRFQIMRFNLIHV